MAGLVAAGLLFLRFWSPSPLWLDEAQSVAIARLPLPELLGALRHDGSPPLYYLMLHGWIAAFGTGDVAVRTLSGVLSVLALPLMWQVGRRLGGGRRAGVVAVAVLAASPWAVRYATEARMYSLLVLLVLLGTLATLSLPRPGPRPVVALGAVTGLLLLTHYWSFFLVGVLAAAAVWAAWRRPAARRVAVRGLSALAVGGLLFLPWLPSFVFQVTHTGAPWAEPAQLGRLTSLPLEWAGGTAPAARWLVLLFWPLLLLGAAVLPEGDWSWPDERRRPMRRTGRLLAGLTLATLLLALGVTRALGSGVEVRYTAVVVPFVLLLVALGVLALPPRHAVGALAGLVGIGLLAGIEAGGATRTQAGDVAATLNRLAAPGDVVIYCPDQLAPAVSRLLVTEDLDQVSLPRSRELTRVDWVDYEERVDDTIGELVADGAMRRADGGAVWVLTSPRYATHAQVCGEVRRGLAERGARPRIAVRLDQAVYEYAVLERWTRRLATRATAAG